MSANDIQKKQEQSKPIATIPFVTKNATLTAMHLVVWILNLKIDTLLSLAGSTTGQVFAEIVVASVLITYMRKFYM